MAGTRRPALNTYKDKRNLSGPKLYIPIPARKTESGVHSSSQRSSSFSPHKTGIIISYRRSGELSQLDAMHLHVLLYKSKIYLFLINYLFIIA